METTVRRNGKVYRQRFERGVPVTDVEVVGKCSPDETGTTQTFLRDDTIFQVLEIRGARWRPGCEWPLAGGHPPDG